MGSIDTLTVIAPNASKLIIVSNKEWCGEWVPLKGLPMKNDPKISSQWVKSLKLNLGSLNSSSLRYA